MLKAKLIKRDISELSPIGTVNDFQAVWMIIVQPQSQELKVLKYLIFALQEKNPRVMRVAVNNEKNVPLALPWSEPEKDRQCPYVVIVQDAQSSRC
jgi:hypothetical protein